MSSLPKPEVILTHESDLDGLLAGLLSRQLARHLFNVDVPLQAFHNHNWRQRLLTEKSAWVCDLAFEARLDRPDWLVIDHHPTSTIPRQAKLIHDTTQSAAALTYRLCVEHGLGQPQLERLVHLSNVADLFLLADPDFELAHDYASLVKSYGFWNLAALTGMDPLRLLDHPLLEVMRVKRQVEDPIGLAWSREHVSRVSDTVGLVENIVGNTNLIVHRLLEQGSTPFPVLISLFRRGNGTYMASVRSRNGEAMKVAERLQGGGHPNASGAALPRSVHSSADALQYLRQVLGEPEVPPASGDGLDSLFEAARP